MRKKILKKILMRNRVSRYILGWLGFIPITRIGVFFLYRSKKHERKMEKSLGK